MYRSRYCLAHALKPMCQGAFSHARLLPHVRGTSVRVDVALDVAETGKIHTPLALLAMENSSDSHTVRAARNLLESALSMINVPRPQGVVNVSGNTSVTYLNS